MYALSQPCPRSPSTQTVRNSTRKLAGPISVSKRCAPLIALGMFFAAPLWGQVTGVDWGGSYGNGFNDMLNQGIGKAEATQGDYTFDGEVDSAYGIPFESLFTPSADQRYSVPDGKTGTLYTGTMLVNHGGLVPLADLGVYRWSASSNPNELQRTVPQMDSNIGPMSLSVSYLVRKRDFLNGLDKAKSLRFADQPGGAAMKVSALRNMATGVAMVGFIVQEGADWFISPTFERPASRGDWEGTLEINPSSADWYAFDPEENPFFNTEEPGTAREGSTFTDINAFGVICQISNYDGSAGNRHKVNFTAFSATFQPNAAP
jgi:hypothetical protein